MEHNEKCYTKHYHAFNYFPPCFSNGPSETAMLHWGDFNVYRCVLSKMFGYKIIVVSTDI